MDAEDRYRTGRAGRRGAQAADGRHGGEQPIRRTGDLADLPGAAGEPGGVDPPRVDAVLLADQRDELAQVCRLVRAGRLPGRGAGDVPGEAAAGAPGALRVGDEETMRVGGAVELAHGLLLGRGGPGTVQVHHERQGALRPVPLGDV